MASGTEPSSLISSAAAQTRDQNRMSAPPPPPGPRPARVGIKKPVLAWGGRGLDRAVDGRDGDMVQERLERLAPVLPRRRRRRRSSAAGLSRRSSLHVQRRE